MLSSVVDVTYPYLRRYALTLDSEASSFCVGVGVEEPFGQEEEEEEGDFPDDDVEKGVLPGSGNDWTDSGEKAKQR